MTNRQEAALEFIAKNQRTTVVGPSLRELAAHLGVFPNAAQQVVVALRKLGLVAPNKRNGIVIVNAEDRPILPAIQVLSRGEREPILRPSEQKKLSARRAGNDQPR